MVLLLSSERIKLEGCACARIEALEEGNRWCYLDDAGDLSERGRNAANLISDYGGVGGCTYMMLGICQKEGGMQQT